MMLCSSMLKSANRNCTRGERQTKFPFIYDGCDNITLPTRQLETPNFASNPAELWGGRNYESFQIKGTFVCRIPNASHLPRVLVPAVASRFNIGPFIKRYGFFNTRVVNVIPARPIANAKRYWDARGNSPIGYRRRPQAIRQILCPRPSMYTPQRTEG